MTLVQEHSIEVWDGAVERFPDGSVYQTSAWAAAKGQRTEPLIVMERDRHGRVEAGAQLLIRRLAPLTKAAYVPYGPLVRNPDDRARIVQSVENAARRAGCSVLLIQPSRTDWDTAAHLETRGYQRAPIDVATPATLEVVLGRPDESIVADLAKSRRRNVRRAERRGVVVERGGRSDVRSLELLYAASARRQGFLPMSYDYLLRQWDVLHPAGHLQLFLAKVEGRTLAAGTLLGYGRYAEFKLTGWKATTEAKRCFVNEALNWAMISWANYSGFQVFDLGGLPRQQAIDATQRGIPAVLRGTTSEFKHGWGGSVVVYPPAYQKVLRPLGRLTYELPARLLDDQGLGGRMVNWVRQT